MARRARKPLLPSLIFGPQKRTYRRAGRVAVRRVPDQTVVVPSGLVEDFLLAAGVCLGLVACIIVGA